MQKLNFSILESFHESVLTLLSYQEILNKRSNFSDSKMKIFLDFSMNESLYIYTLSIPSTVEDLPLFVCFAQRRFGSRFPLFSRFFCNFLLAKITCKKKKTVCVCYCMKKDYHLLLLAKLKLENWRIIFKLEGKYKMPSLLDVFYAINPSLLSFSNKPFFNQEYFIHQILQILCFKFACAIFLIYIAE